MTALRRPTAALLRCYRIGRSMAQRGLDYVTASQSEPHDIERAQAFRRGWQHGCRVRERGRA